MSSRRHRSKRSRSFPESSASNVACPQQAQPATSHAGRNGRLLLGLTVLAAGAGALWYFGQPEHAVQNDPGRTNPPGNRNASLEKADKFLAARNDQPLAPLTTVSVKGEQARAQAQLDPAQDGWETEVVADRAARQLTRLGARLSGHHPIQDVSTEVAADVICGRLRPAELAEVYRDGAGSKEIMVRRAANGSAAAVPYRGRAGLAHALDDLAEPYNAASDVHVHFKVIRVTCTADTAETTAYFEADGRTTGGLLQQRATWTCRWRRTSQRGLLLNSIRTADYEEAVEIGPWLVDCTRSVLGKNESFRGQLAYGLNHWLSRLGRVRGIHAFARTGLAVGDVNGDGLDDVYLCQPGGLPNRLFVQQPDGSALDRSHVAGVDWLDPTSSALIVDLDNDGDQDLVAATSTGLLVMENNGAGTFRLQATLAARDNDPQSLAAADYDSDGDLDLYICIEFANPMALSNGPKVAFVYHDANDGAANILYRNDRQADGKWRFTDVTRQIGLDTDNRRHSLACAWEDYDNDGDQDLYVANDYGQNCLYQNDGGHFQNVAQKAGVVDSASGMSASWADYNHDGWMDLYVANMFSSAGSRITRQARFKAGADDALRKIYARFAKGNTLLENDGHGRFRDVSRQAGVEMGRWAWSSLFADMNNDAWDDLLVANGYISTEDTGDL